MVATAGVHEKPTNYRNQKEIVSFLALLYSLINCKIDVKSIDSVHIYGIGLESFIKFLFGGRGSVYMYERAVPQAPCFGTFGGALAPPPDPLLLSVVTGSETDDTSGTSISKWITTKLTSYRGSSSFNWIHISKLYT
jgi:hypothetical protein